MFIGQAGWNKCGECNKIVCGSCSTAAMKYIDGATKKLTHNLCLGCYASEMLVQSNTNKQYFCQVDDMRNELKHRFKFDDVDNM